MQTEAQNEIIKQIDGKGVTKALGDMSYWFAAEEVCVDVDDPKGNKIEEGDRIFEFIALDKPKILLVIKEAQE